MGIKKVWVCLEHVLLLPRLVLHGSLGRGQGLEGVFRSQRNMASLTCVLRAYTVTLRTEGHKAL